MIEFAVLLLMTPPMPPPAIWLVPEPNEDDGEPGPLAVAPPPVVAPPPGRPVGAAPCVVCAGGVAAPRGGWLPVAWPDGVGVPPRPPGANCAPGPPCPCTM